MEPSREEPAQLPPEHVVPEEAPRSSQQDTPAAEDIVPQPVTFQDMRSYLEAVDEEEQALIRAELTPDTREAGTQAALLPARRSQTPPPTFAMSTNPDGSVTL